MLAVVTSAGCNPLLLLGYLSDTEDPKTNAKFPLKPAKGHEKEEVRVVVLTSCAPDDPSMMNIDRMLAAEFIQLLEKRCADNKENVKVLKSSVIDEFKRNTPNWRNMSPYEIGKKFNGANYVIDIEVLRISTVEPKSQNQLMRGRAQVAVAAFDLSKPLAEPAYNPPEMPFVYPSVAAVSINDIPASTFRQEFVRNMAKSLVNEFTAHTTNDRLNLPSADDR